MLERLEALEPCRIPGLAAHTHQFITLTHPGKAYRTDIDRPLEVIEGRLYLTGRPQLASDVSHHHGITRRRAASSVYVLQPPPMFTVNRTP